MNTWRIELESALAKAREGREVEALDELARAVERAFAESDLRGLKSLAMNAAVFSEELGQIQRARQYLELALTHHVSDPLVLFALGNLNLRHGVAKLGRAAICSLPRRMQARSG